MNTSAACIGNDVVDLASPGSQAAFPRKAPRLDWLKRHLTANELTRISGQTDLFNEAWSVFAAKEAAYKAFAQAGIGTPFNGFHLIEVDLGRLSARHLPTGREAELRFDSKGDRVHAIAVVSANGERAFDRRAMPAWDVRDLPAGADPSDFVRDCLLDFVEKTLVGKVRASELAMTSVDGIPKVLRSGTIQDWSVSLSHSGRYVAFGFLKT